MTSARGFTLGTQVGVVSAAAVGMALGYGNLLWICFSLFVHPLSVTFGWSRSEISLGVAMMNVMIVLMTPVMGASFDRWGVRTILLPGTALFALGLSLIALFDGSLWRFYLTMIFIGIMGTVATPAGYNRVLVEWFDRRRGLALGLAVAGTGLGGMILPPVVNLLIERGGTSLASLFLGAAVALIALPVAYVFLNEREGGQHEQTRGLPRRLGEFLRNPRFAKLAIAFFSLGVFATGTVVHLAPLLIDRGVSPAGAALAMTSLAAAITFGRVLAGYLLDKLPPWGVLVPFLSAPVIGLAGLAFGANGHVALLCSFLVGLGIGAELDFLPFLVSRYFPLRSFGRNFGIMFSITSLGGVLGPVLMGGIFDRFGDYTYGLWTLCGLVMFGLLVVCSCGSFPEQRDRIAAPDADVPHESA